MIEQLFAKTNPRGKDLTAVRRLDEALGHPHAAYRTVHVGGTNGKGSVAHKVAAALQNEGYRVGLYTSPHISDVRERIRVNGAMISENDLYRLLAPLLSEPVGFFDVMTLLAFSYFKEQKVDWVVVEVGLGGRFDATNIITPEIAAITSIGFDHMHLLGNTLEEIAREKGGIAKPGVPLIAGPTAAPFFEGAISTAPRPFYDEENGEIARAVLEYLSVSEASIAEGLLARPPCRFEQRGNAILDVAHNPDGFRKLVQALKGRFPKTRGFHFVVGFSKDKDWKGCLDLIADVATSITAVSLNKERLVSPLVLQEYNGNIGTAASVRQALKEDGLNVVCGSFYLMDEATGGELKYIL